MGGFRGSSPTVQDGVGEVALQRETGEERGQGEEKRETERPNASHVLWQEGTEGCRKNLEARSTVVC